jgi:hypothetical protein
MNERTTTTDGIVRRRDAPTSTLACVRHSVTLARCIVSSAMISLVHGKVSPVRLQYNATVRSRRVTSA